MQMFSSPEWDSSTWAFQGLFNHISGIVKTNDVFWYVGGDVLKVTKPIVDVLFILLRTVQWVSCMMPWIVQNKRLSAVLEIIMVLIGI